MTEVEDSEKRRDADSEEPRAEDGRPDGQDWNGDNDPDNPYNWPRMRKWRVTLTACFVTFVVGLNSTGITAAPKEINRRFHVSDANFPNSFWPVTAWNTGAAIAPMIALPILESHGYRNGYLMTYLIFTAFVLPQAFAPNFGTLVGTRFISGCCGGILQDVMDGIIADIWPGPIQRSLPVTTYVFSLLVGVTLGPVIGGGIVGGGLYWRWILYVQLIIYASSFPFIYVSMRETRGTVILARRTAKLQKSGDTIGSTASSSSHHCFLSFLNEAVGLPARLLCTEPVCLYFTVLSGLSYGLVFLSTQSVGQVYSTNYGWNDSQVGLLQTSVAIGEIIGYFACIIQDVFWARKYTQATAQNAENAEDAKADSLPEIRLYIAIPGCFLGFAAGLLLYGCTSLPSPSSTSIPYSWPIPAIGLALLGFGTMTVMQAIMMYITDSYAKYAGSASAAVCAGENLFAAFLPLAASEMYSQMGFRWASVMLGFVALGLGAGAVVLLWKGMEIRRRSPFMKVAGYD